MEQATVQIEDAFERWEAGSGRVAFREPQLPDLPARSVRPTPTRGTQTLVRLSCRLHEPNEQNYAARQVLAEVLADTVQSDLRLHRGLTYGAHGTQFDAGDGTGRLTLWTRVPSASTTVTMSSMLAAIHQTHAGTLDPADFTRVRQFMATGQLRRFTTARSTLEVLGTATHRGWSLDTVVDAGSAMNQVQPASLGPLLEDCVGHEQIEMIGPASGLMLPRGTIRRVQ